MLTKKDIVILTATINRPDDLEMTIKGVVENGNIPGKMIILDQSKDNKTKKLVEKYAKKYKFIEYTHHKIPGKNIALNKVMDKLKKSAKYKVLCVMDDDVVLQKGYFDAVLREFNSNEHIKGVGAVELRKDFKEINYNSLKFKLNCLIFDFFKLSHKENHKLRMLGPYGNTSTHKLEKDIRDCAWLPGFVSTYRFDVFKNYRLPEQIGREIIQDIDMGYYTYLKYGKGCLVIPKDAKAVHNFSETGRFGNIDKRRIFVNHEDHFTFFFRYFNNFSGRIKMIWEIFWILFLMTGNAAAKPNKDNILKLKYNFEAIKYCIKYKDKIKKGENRMFLNPDMAMRDDI